MIGCMDDKVFPLLFALQKIRKQGYAWIPVTWLDDRREMRIPGAIWSLTRKASQRRQNLVHQDSKGQEPGCYRPAIRSLVFVPRQ